jgi:serine/threonine protein kinase
MPNRLARFRREAQVLASLNHPHIGVIYRLMKPTVHSFLSSNSDGQVKVLDFGLAKSIEPAVSGDLANSPTLTSPAMMTGIGWSPFRRMAPRWSAWPTDACIAG